MAYLPHTKPRNAGLFRLSGKVHIFEQFKNLGEPRAAKRPCFKEFGGFLHLWSEVVEISTEVKIHISAKGELHLLAAPSPGSQ